MADRPHLWRTEGRLRSCDCGAREYLSTRYAPGTPHLARDWLGDSRPCPLAASRPPPPPKAAPVPKPPVAGAAKAAGPDPRPPRGEAIAAQIARRRAALAAMGIARDCRDVDVLRATIARGVIKADLAHHLGVTPSTLGDWLSGRFRPNTQRVFADHQQWRGWTPALIQDAVRMAEDGMSKSAIAAAFGCGKGVIIGKLRRLKRAQQVHANT
jgi:transposase-like protein